MQNQTIAAISTPYGRGGVAKIRISGSDAIEVAEKLFKPKNGRKLGDMPPRSAIYGDIFDLNDKSSAPLDDAIAIFFRAPHSYTGEDTVELDFHGGILLSQRVLASCITAGARPAEAGEFTRRAFVSGHLTLSQAEAVIGKIDAVSDAQLKLASSQARGTLSRALEKITEKLASLISAVYAVIDYPDEDLAEYTTDEILSHTRGIEESLRALCATYKAGSAIAEGIDCVIAGLPNTGKSSLLNMLLGRERAIVTDIAGTTRDVIEETVSLGQVTLRLCDTAGIRESGDAVEQIGVEMALSRMERAGLLLAVFDGSKPLDEEESLFLDRCREVGCAKIAIINKEDLGITLDVETIRGIFDEVVTVSAKLGCGREAIASVVERLFEVGSIDYDNSAMLVNARQHAAASSALDAITRAADALEAGAPADIAGLELELAMGALGELDGRRVTEEIVDRIFHRFCVGK
ncbi:MAG: tRNA uridine-5-carboxymethylaminomethyl(34) synthesis GTPase MnmE [Clostridia bacterium]|nr:tRNA uridine-5-carboxymethylaminomethyl(34) synthesis GTPase MnmE [Clostridia bacterium]